MGAETSKIDSKTIDNNVTALINRLNQNQEEIDKHVVDQIRRTLNDYLIAVKKSTNVDRQTATKLKSLVDTAEHILDRIPTKTEHVRTEAIGKVRWRVQLDNTMTYVRKLQAKIQKGNVTEDDLKELTTYSKQISSVRVKHEELNKAKKAISVMILEVFVKMTPESKKKIVVKQTRIPKQQNLETESKDKQNEETKIRKFLGSLKDAHNQSKSFASENHSLSDSNLLQTFDECKKVIEAINKEIERKIKELQEQKNQTDHNKKETKRPLESQKTDQNQIIWKIQNTLEQHKKYVQRFDQPTRSNIYTQKRQEIASLKQHLDNMPHEKKNVICTEIDKVLNTLNIRANECEEIVKSLEHLDELANQVNTIQNSLLPARLKAKELENCRRKVNSVVSTDPRVTLKKGEIITKLKKSDKVFNLRDSLRNNLWKISATLDKYRAEAQKFTYPKSTNAYKKKHQEISALFEDLKQAPENGDEKQIVFMQITETLKLLDDVACRNEKKHKCLASLEEIEKEVNEPNSKNKLKQLEDKVCGIEDLDDEIKLEKNEIMKKIISLNSKVPEAKQTEKILDLQQYFQFNPNDLSCSKESVQYIQEVRKWAETFDSQVKQYVGNNYSVEYFVLDENLMRLLEALDQVKCHHNQEMLNEKIKTINYIKELHDQLDANATYE